MWSVSSRDPYERPILALIIRRAAEPRRFIQVLAGPRQVGKTTLARQMLAAIDLPSHYASADDPALRDGTWLEQQWAIGRLRAAENRRGAVLVIDEAQKLPGWSDLVKLLWDEDTAAGTKLRVFLLGSSPLLVGRGLTESLAGRFETIPVTHWGFTEMRDAFGWNLDRYLYFGGYPGAAPLVRDEERWRAYILDSLVETSISRDVLLLTRVDKPALLRQLFQLACTYSGQILSYTKMVGQLQDAWQHHHARALPRPALRRRDGHRTRQVLGLRAPPPRVEPEADRAQHRPDERPESGRSFREARAELDWWGRLIESAVGAHLLNSRTETLYSARQESRGRLRRPPRHEARRARGRLRGAQGVVARDLRVQVAVSQRAAAARGRARNSGRGVPFITAGTLAPAMSLRGTLQPDVWRAHAPRSEFPHDGCRPMVQGRKVEVSRSTVLQAGFVFPRARSESSLHDRRGAEVKPIIVYHFTTFANAMAVLAAGAMCSNRRLRASKTRIADIGDADHRRVSLEGLFNLIRDYPRIVLLGS